MEDLKENKVQGELMSEEEFKEHLSNRIMPLKLETYIGVSKYKSVRRAIRRGNISTEGLLIPKRPFSNKRNTCSRGKHSRQTNEEKKLIYASIQEYRKRHLDD